MSPSRYRFYKGLFLVATIYDLSLGIIFTFFSRFAFQRLGITDQLPDFGGYLSLIGAFLLVIGVAYLLIYLGDLQRNRDLVSVGALYKLAYCSIAFYYFALGQIPHVIFILGFGVADFLFFILMLECRIFLSRLQSA
jgi:hypothetical protein